MGETNQFQPLTREDRVTVILYRGGIVLSALLLAIGSYLLHSGRGDTAALNVLFVVLHAAAGLSVIFIHLYISRFHRALKKLYLLALLALVLLFVIGGGDPAGYLAHNPWGLLLLLPLSGCLGFVTAKEAFCFRLYEGYMLAILMPFYLALVSSGEIPREAAVWGLVLIAGLLVVFTLRKVFMPIHYDIGDKSAYV